MAIKSAYYFLVLIFPLFLLGMEKDEPYEVSVTCKDGIVQIPKTILKKIKLLANLHEDNMKLSINRISKSTLTFIKDMISEFPHVFKNYQEIKDEKEEYRALERLEKYIDNQIGNSSSVSVLHNNKQLNN